MATRADGFETLYTDERARLARRTVPLAGDRAEDIVHDAFLTYLTRDEVIIAPRAWLERVARNRALNELRRAREVPLPEDVAVEQDAAPVERDAIRAVVAHALGDLDERSRTALRLRFFEERSYEDIARELEVRVSQAHVVLHRSLRRLGRAIVRRLASAHGVSECAPALEEIAGFGRQANGHGAAACERCKPVLDELAALRTLGLLPAGFGAIWLRRIDTETLARAPSLSDLIGQVTNAIVALGIAATAVVAPQIQDASVAPPARDHQNQPIVSVERDRSTGTQDRTIPATSERGGRTIPDGSRTIGDDDGPVGVRMADDHIQGEVKDESGATEMGGAGAVVCEPLQPCPPPPSSGP
jgi:RNA polymerase sigma-70 factor (ECF subfamily)